MAYDGKFNRDDEIAIILDSEANATDGGGNKVTLPIGTLGTVADLTIGQYAMIAANGQMYHLIAQEFAVLVDLGLLRDHVAEYRAARTNNQSAKSSEAIIPRDRQEASRVALVCAAGASTYLES